jgi:diguanylate cyclase (GGDEF)-like protein
MIIETPDGRAIQIVNEPLADGGWVATHEDITERRRAEARITHLAHYDALTDLPNRALFHEQLKRELARIAPGEQLAVLYIDIDEFKSVNDTLGHLIGDELLKSVAVSLGRCIRDTDFVARLGGDEFAIVQTGVRTADDVTDLVTRVLNTIREPYECLGHQVTTDASIGIALAPQHGADLDQILKNADLAMYAAKSAGRRTYRFFEPEMDARVRARRILEMDLRQAISDGAFEVHYQPCVSLRDNKITGCEALLRWRHSERGMISPAEFIPIAEETGLIDQLGEWVLTTACAEATTWPDHIKLAVNVSPVQFKSGTLALKIVAALAASGLPASRLELEITEAVLIRDDEAALAILHQLRAIGVRIALDDFGTGYSSLSYLQRFPFDKIKIDRCFVNDIAEPEGSSCIVQAVVNIAAARQMTTTAEGVETQQQRELLRALGCAEMQGYLFSPAKPAAEIRQLFHREQPADADLRPRRKRRQISTNV